MDIVRVQCPAHIGVGLCGALHGNQVIAQRNDWQEQEYDHTQGEHLRLARAGMRCASAHPERYERKGAKCPGNVEKDLHL